MIFSVNKVSSRSKNSCKVLDDIAHTSNLALSNLHSRYQMAARANIDHVPSPSPRVVIGVVRWACKPCRSSIIDPEAPFRSSLMIPSCSKYAVSKGPVFQSPGSVECSSNVLCQCLPTCSKYSRQVSGPSNPLPQIGHSLLSGGDLIQW